VKGKRVRNSVIAVASVAVGFALAVGIVLADGTGDPKAVKSEDGKYFDKEGTPTYNVAGDGTVDWFTYSGYRRYHSECHVCHGPDGEGSSYGPPVKDSLKTMNYTDFLDVVVNGRKNVGTAAQNVMPALGTNANVMCYLDDIYIYLRARANNAVERVRPEKRERKPEAVSKAEKTCLGESG
jgi:methanol metabolism-related c-type cytochrome